jgi:hypothetical protein
MVDAYLRWRYNYSSNVMPTQPSPPSHTGDTGADSALPASSASSNPGHVTDPTTTPTISVSTNNTSTDDTPAGNVPCGDTSTIVPCGHASTIVPSVDGHLTNNSPTPSVSTNSSPPHPSDPAARGSGLPFPDVAVEISVIDIYALSTSIKINVSSAGTDTTASALAELGFIGNVPFKPSVAISIKTLELYRVLRRRKPSFSIEAFVKVVSDIYMVGVIFIISTPFLLGSRSRTAPSIVVFLRMHSTSTSISSELSRSV